MNDSKPKLTLDRHVTYQIQVPGALDEKWLDWNEEMAVNIEYQGNETITTLTIATDQAGLQGLLRYLYSLGLPLFSVVWVDFDKKLTE